MPSRYFWSHDRRFGLEMTPKNLREIVGYCKAALPNETGGILVGRYSPKHDLAIVSGVSAPPADSRSGRSWFTRGVEGLQNWLNRLWRSKNYYLGEWHFHPLAEPNPSGTDIGQMAEIASSGSYKCPEPILAIVGGDPRNTWKLRVFVYSQENLLELIEVTR